MKISRDPIHRGYEVNTGKFKNLAYYTKIMDRIIDQITHLLDHHSRITVLRIDPKLPDIPGISITHKNSMISTFIDKIKKQLTLSKWGAKKRVCHGWVLEFGESGLPHYHLFFAFETSFLHLGSFNTQNPTGFWKFLVECARETFGGSLHFAGRHIVNRNNPSQINECIRHLSYFAKVRTKDFGANETYKRFGFSQIKPPITHPHRKPPNTPHSKRKHSPLATPLA